MKLEIIKDRLKEALINAERITSKNASLPILNSVILEASGSVLGVKATNLEVGIEIQVPAKIDKPGSVAISGQVLINFLSNLYKEDKVVIEEVGGNISISTKNGSTLVKCSPVDDFPSIPHVTDGFSFSLPARDLVTNIKAVSYAAAISDIKPEIASVYVYYESPALVFVATDSFRLAEKKISIGNKIEGEGTPLIIPFKNTMEIVRVFEGVESMVTIQANKHQLSVYTDSIHFTSRLIDSVFPDYRQIIPKDHDTEVVISKSEFLNALKLANVFSDRLNQIDIKVIPSENIFEINSKNQDVGENTINLQTKLTGEEVQMSFNVKYLLDCFQSLPGDDVVLHFKGPQRPVVVLGTGTSTFTYLVMPVRR